MIGKKSPVADNDSENHLLMLHGPITPCHASCFTLGREADTINKTKQQQGCAPPYVRMQLEQHHSRMLGRIDQLINPRRQNQRSIYRQRYADKKPDRNHCACLLAPRSTKQTLWPSKRFLPENNIQ